MTVKQSRKGTARQTGQDKHVVDEREQALVVHTLAHVVYRTAAMRYAAYLAPDRMAHPGFNPVTPLAPVTP